MTIKRQVIRELGLSDWAKWANAAKKAAGRKEAGAPPAGKAPATDPPKPAANDPPPAAEAPDGGFLPASVTLKELAGIVASCERCPLCKGRNKTAFGRGAADGCEILIVGEGPGEEEDRQGEPFVGRAGKLLDSMLAAAGIDVAEAAYITNVVKCRPPDNRNPVEEEIRACDPYLRRQVELLSPKLLLVLGRVAGNALLRPGATMADMRGKVRDVNGIPAVATYHPAYLLRKPSEKRKSWDDLVLAKRTLAGL